MLPIAATDAALAQALQREWASNTFANTAYHTQHPSATELTFDTMLDAYRDSGGWATTLQGPTGAGREILRITARLDSTEIAALDIGKVCTVTMPRLGLSTGKNYLVTGIQADAVRGTADLTLWG